MSIEQSQPFHQIRRLLRVVAPEFRILASSELDAGQSVLNLMFKTVEVSEEFEVYEAVAVSLFHLGHILLKKNPDFALLFGIGIAQWQHSEEDLVECLSILGHKADLSAFHWAREIFMAYWSVDQEKATDLLCQHVWSKKAWKKYFTIS